MLVPKSVRRLAVEIEGWLDLGCPERALAHMQPLLDTPGARPVALVFRVRALVELQQYREAIAQLAELRSFGGDIEWIEVTDAWCRKRLDDLPSAIECMERLIGRKPRSAIGHFNLGCYLALTGELDRALDEVSLACGLDPEFRALAANEGDLASLRGRPEFDELAPPDQASPPSS